MCDLVDELCDNEPTSVCEKLKSFTNTNPTYEAFIDKAFELMGNDKATRVFEKLSDDMEK